MGYRFNRLDNPVLMAVSKPLLTEFGIHLRMESCGRGHFNEINEHIVHSHDVRSLWLRKSSLIDIDRRDYLSKRN